MLHGLQAIWYAFFAQPAPAIGLLDFYLFGPLAIVLEKKWSVEQLTLRDRMGGGNFGQVYEGVINPPGAVEYARPWACERSYRTFT